MPTALIAGVLKAAVADLRRLKSWVEGREVAFAQRIAKVSSFPEKSLAEAGRHLGASRWTTVAACRDRRRGAGVRCVVG